MRLIAVVLHAPSSNVRFQEASKLLNYGFSKYKKESIVDANETMGEVKVIKGSMEKVSIVTKEGYSQLLEKTTNKEFEKELSYNENISAPIKKGDKLGEMVIKDNGVVVKTIDLISAEDVNKINYFDFFNKLSREYLIF